MEQLARIEARLNSLDELGDLVGALRSMAASRVREAQEAREGTRAFRSIIDRAISEMAPAVAWPKHAQGNGTGVLLLITSQNGFVGGFNETIVEAGLSDLQPGERLIVVGRRGEAALQAQKLTAERAFAMTSRAAGVTRLARRISRQLTDVSTARIVHAHHLTGAEYEPRIRPVLPLVAPKGNGNADAPLHHLPPDRLMTALAGEYLFAEVADALMDSLASENAARLRSMDSASRNIEDKLEHLKRKAHISRQEEMTADMIDVVTGAEAIFGG